MRIYLDLPYKLSLLISLLETLTRWSLAHPGEEILIVPLTMDLTPEQRAQVEALLEAQTRDEPRPTASA